MAEIARMIAETERWRLDHKAAGRVIDAAARATPTAGRSRQRRREHGRELSA